MQMLMNHQHFSFETIIDNKHLMKKKTRKSNQLVNYGTKPLGVLKVKNLGRKTL